jgi:hypothetical protein
MFINIEQTRILVTLLKLLTNSGDPETKFQFNADTSYHYNFGGKNYAFNPVLMWGIEPPEQKDLIVDEYYLNVSDI